MVGAPERPKRDMIIEPTKMRSLSKEKDGKMRVQGLAQFVLVPLFTAAFTLSASASNSQGQEGQQGGGGWGYSRSAPGPVIGIGLPAVAAVGLYAWFRGRQRR